jgi:hypothetical protein
MPSIGLVRRALPPLSAALEFCCRMALRIASRLLVLMVVI